MDCLDFQGLEAIVDWRKFQIFPWVMALALVLSTVLTACGLPQVNAQERIFLDLSLEFLDNYELPKRPFQDTPVGGLSGITYDRQRDRFYVISDDRGDYAPPRFYTLKLNLDSNSSDTPKIASVEIESVTLLKAADGNPYPIGEMDAEGIAFASPNSVYIASEGITRKGLAPFIHEINLETGQFVRDITLPKRYIPDNPETPTQGIQDNLGLESLTLNPRGFGDATVDPYRLFTVTEAPLIQDLDELDADIPPKNRLLHYLISDGPPILISENLYTLDDTVRWSLYQGLSELLALEQGGHLLSLERNFGFLGFGAKIFEIQTGSATDTSRIASLKGELKKVEPIKKRLLLNLQDLGIELDNLEGMTLGPRLADGSQSLIMVSDDNFSPDQVNQILLFRLKL
ncbi:esterase-like activity of phytase family protein [Laspinema olomoucense]|uniref:esterase-like activity of phytase family protein n=1 Tax=Laspinema olomoucense TaxID=3231600 RepID=UPI0021BB2E08|nr:esterase-like activity of phytase family protein [Laspinema sp. D3c]MCT7992614.1 esterase-like activity of phytase family protein [Laspinema sp. D3c]